MYGINSQLTTYLAFIILFFPIYISAFFNRDPYSSFYVSSLNSGSSIGTERTGQNANPASFQKNSWGLFWSGQHPFDLPELTKQNMGLYYDANHLGGSIQVNSFFAESVYREHTLSLQTSYGYRIIRMGVTGLCRTVQMQGEESLVYLGDAMGIYFVPIQKLTLGIMAQDLLFASTYPKPFAPLIQYGLGIYLHPSFQIRLDFIRDHHKKWSQVLGQSLNFFGAHKVNLALKQDPIEIGLSLELFFHGWKSLGGIKTHPHLPLTKSMGLQYIRNLPS